MSEQDFINTGKLGEPSNWIETSTDNEFRKQYAGVGYTYSVDNNIFVRPFLIIHKKPWHICNDQTIIILDTCVCKDINIYVKTI